MTFRDDRDALFARLEAVLHENTVLQRQNAELQRVTRPSEPVPLPGGIVACLTCGRPNDFRKSDCAYCGAALRGNNSFVTTLRGHTPWPAITRQKTLGVPERSTHGPLARGPSHARTIVVSVLLAAAILGLFIASKLLPLDGVG